MFKNGVDCNVPLALRMSIFPLRVVTKRRPVPSPALTISCGEPSAVGIVANRFSPMVILLGPGAIANAGAAKPLITTTTASARPRPDRVRLMMLLPVPLSDGGPDHMHL